MGSLEHFRGDNLFQSVLFKFFSNCVRQVTSHSNIPKAAERKAERRTNLVFLREIP